MYFLLSVYAMLYFPLYEIIYLYVDNKYITKSINYRQKKTYITYPTIYIDRYA